MKAKIHEEYNRLLNPPENANAHWYRERGRRLESLVQSILEIENLQPRIRYRPDGEEIDGSFIFGDKVYLLELKWHSKELPASSIYQFKGKVDGKLIGTIGVFISLSGYSEDAVDALSLGKTLNVILFNQEDFEACIFEEEGFRKVLSTKLRHAADEGSVFYPYKSVNVKTQPLTPQLLSFQSISESIVTENAISTIATDLIIVCEGNRDREIILGLISKIAVDKRVKTLTIVVALGKYIIPKVISSIAKYATNKSELIIVVDSDGDEEKTATFFLKKTNVKRDKLIITHPSIEAWLFETVPDRVVDNLTKDARLNKKSVCEYIYSLVNGINIDDLKARDRSFRQFYNIIVNE